MRPIKLVPALAAAASLLALAPAQSFARHRGHRHHAANRLHRLIDRHAAATRACRLTLEAPTVITAGEKAEVFGKLICPGASATALSEVTILQRAAKRGRRATTFAAKATVEGGAFKFEASPTSNTTYVAVAAGIHSAHKTIKVAPVVTLKEPPEGTQLLTGRGALVGAPHAHSRVSNLVTFKGTVNPFYAGEIVGLQRENATANEEWHHIARGIVNAKGEFTIPHIFVVPGEANLRVVAHPRGNINATGASTAVSYTISQPQNPALTIKASADPISFGQSVAISGVAANAGSQPVTLLARPRGSKKLTPVATGTTQANGEYSFTQTPLGNTAYQVTVGATKSAVLFEGVKYVLTAVPSATSVQAGSPVTFTGTVSPARAGHPIYIERQNASGVNYHVVEVGTVSAGGTYSISHAFFGAGVAKLRVKIPGDPENQGVASPPVQVTITPAPASLLRPPAPVKQPSEGQL
jgi:hypothetical protein